MSYFGYQGIHTKSPLYRHRDGSVSHERPCEGIIAYHDACAHKAFSIDTSLEGYGSWHHDKGMSWSPGRYSMDGHPCEHCGEPC